MCRPSLQWKLCGNHFYIYISQVSKRYSTEEAGGEQHGQDLVLLKLILLTADNQNRWNRSLCESVYEHLRTEMHWQTNCSTHASHSSAKLYVSAFTLQIILK